MFNKKLLLCLKSLILPKSPKIILNTRTKLLIYLKNVSCLKLLKPKYASSASLIPRGKSPFRNFVHLYEKLLCLSRYFLVILLLQQKSRTFFQRVIYSKILHFYLLKSLIHPNLIKLMKDYHFVLHYNSKNH